MVILQEPLGLPVTAKYFSWLADLVNPTDETWLERFGHDLVVYESLLRAYNFLGDEGKASIYASLSQTAFNELVIHDTSTLTESHGIDL